MAVAAAKGAQGAVSSVRDLRIKYHRLHLTSRPRFGLTVLLACQGPYAFSSSLSAVHVNLGWRTTVAIEGDTAGTVEATLVRPYNQASPTPTASCHSRQGRVNICSPRQQGRRRWPDHTA